MKKSVFMNNKKGFESFLWKRNLGKKMNTKGLEMAWSTIVAMILAILLLAILIIFITMGSGKFGDYFKSFFGYSNVDSVVNSCNLLVQSNSQYGFCCEKKNIKYYLDGKKTQDDFTCFELLNKSFINGINSLECSGAGCG